MAHASFPAEDSARADHAALPDRTQDRMGLVVVNYASCRLIEANLGSLRPRATDIIVVDNWSGADEREEVRARASARGWTLVEMGDNRGFGAGVNAGVRAARALGCRCFLLLNPDAQITEATAAALRLAVLRDPLALISPRLVDSAGRVVFAGSTLDLTDGRIRRLKVGQSAAEPGPALVTWLTAACLAISEELWERVRGFEEDYFLYWEDVDFSYRCVTTGGGHVVFRDDLAAVHDQGGTQGPRKGRAKSGVYYFYNCRNRLLFGARHLNPRQLLSWLVSTPAVSWEILMQGGRRQLVHSPRLAWTALAGATVGSGRAVRQLLRSTARRP